jgi:8-oxo-dGTP pyrophosphatase MutT (NUDIX family)
LNILSRINSHTPEIIVADGCRQAAVALILCEISSRPGMLFIERARNQNDPWSGQIAFPGGNRDPEDDDVLSTAIRETREEVGIQLDQSSLIGRIDDQQGRSNNQAIPLVISCFVFQLDPIQHSTNNHEVADSFWVDLDHLVNPDHLIEYQTPYSDKPYPGVQLDSERVLWGLTYRFVEMFMETIRQNSYTG